MNKLVSPKITALTFGVLVIFFLAAFYVVAWQEPTQAPPEGNVSTPINVGTDPQAKAGRISATEFYDYNDPNYYLNPSGQSKLQTLCFGTDCKDKWPETGIVTTYKMEASSYQVGDEYFSKTVSYDCPEGSSVVNISCSENMVDTINSITCTEDPCPTPQKTNSCSCSGSDNTATLKAYVVQSDIFCGDCTYGSPCAGYSLVDYCYPHTTYDAWGICQYQYDCYIPSGTPQCEMEFQCGILEQVGE
jgi:hypothetical protein